MRKSKPWKSRNVILMKWLVSQVWMQSIKNTLKHENSEMWTHINSLEINYVVDIHLQRIWLKARSLFFVFKKSICIWKLRNKRTQYINLHFCPKHRGLRSRYHCYRQSAAQDGPNGRLSSSFNFFNFWKQETPQIKAETMRHTLMNLVNGGYHLQDIG